MLLATQSRNYGFGSFMRNFGSRVRDTDTNFYGYFRRVHGIDDNKDFDHAFSYGK